MMRRLLARMPKGERGGGDKLVTACITVIIIALLYLAAYVGIVEHAGRGPVPDHTRPAEQPVDPSTTQPTGR